MSFFFKFLTGGALAGGAVLYYHDDIARTSASLQADLKNLSEQLVKSSPGAHPVQDIPSAQPVIPQRLPFTEELKARWNEQLGSAIHTLQTTSYSDLFARTFSQLRSSLASAQQSAPSAATQPFVAESASLAGQPDAAVVKVEEKRQV
ncbi:hypothetical protein JCM8097_003685 [Rhodosporidiobolus ruineniae]